MAPDELFTRDEVLGGLPARRAAATLFLLESRTAYLVDQSRQAANFLVSEDAARRRDLVFLEAFSAGREPPLAITLADLERFAPQWASLVPPTPAIRAALAHALRRKYPFARAAVPRLSAALGLDDPAVAQAYRRQFREELAAIDVARVRPLDRLRVARAALAARVDALPPFWLTFLLTIAFSFSQAFLALPTGVAGLGAITGVALVIGIGVVNVLTMACMAEACARSGDFRYGKAYLARLVSGYLGAEASLVFSIITALRTFLVMLAGSLGIALTLAASTGIRADAWVVVIGAAEFYYLSRKSHNVTIVTMLTLLAVNLGLFLLITGIAAGRIEATNLLGAALPPAGAAAFDPKTLQLVVGVVVMLYIGHIYVIQCAKLVLPRDPSARSLIRGSAAGTVVLVAIFSVWILAVNGVVPAERLAREAGTSLPSLAERIGPTIHVLGVALVVMLLGMSCLRTATVMFNLVQERLPSRLRVVVTLPRRTGDLVFEPRGAADVPRLGVRYLGLSDGQPRLGIDVQGSGTLRRLEVVVPKTWDAAEVLGSVQGAPTRPGTLSVEVLDAEADALRVRVTTTMRMSAAGEWSAGARQPVDLIGLDSPQRELATWLVRRGTATLSEALADRGGAADGLRAALDRLVADGFAERVDLDADPRYRIRAAIRRGRVIPSDLWAALGEPVTPPARPASRAPRPATLAAWRAVLSERGQFVLAASPVLLVVLIAELLLLREAATFAGVLGFTGVIANSMTAGIFPVLLLVASRRKGECVPGTEYRLLGHPAFAAGIYVLAVVNLFLHGLVIYRDPWTRAAALLFGGIALALTVRAVRAGAFAWRSVVELRADARSGTPAVLMVMSGGRPLPADVIVGRPEGEDACRAATVAIPALAKLSHVTVRLPAGHARAVKVWTHQVTADGTTEALPSIVDVSTGGDTRRFDLKLSGGQAVTPTGDGDCTIRIALRRDDGA